MKHCRTLQRRYVKREEFHIAYASEEDAMKAFEAFKKVLAVTDLLADVIADAVQAKKIDEQWLADARVALELAGKETYENSVVCK